MIVRQMMAPCCVNSKADTAVRLSADLPSEEGCHQGVYTSGPVAGSKGSCLKQYMLSRASVSDGCLLIVAVVFYWL